MRDQIPVLWNHDPERVLGRVDVSLIASGQWEHLELGYMTQQTADGGIEVIAISINPGLAMPRDAVRPEPQDDRPWRFLLERPCPKCGSGPTPSTACRQHHPLFKASSIPLLDHHAYIPEDHLHRKCLHCGHERIEIALDAPDLTTSEREAAIDNLLVSWAEKKARALDNWRSGL